MAMLALETDRMIRARDSAIIRQADILALDEMDAFMDTFDQAITVSAEPWDVWARRNKVDQRETISQDYLMMAFLGFSSWINQRDAQGKRFNKVDFLDSTYLVSCHHHGTEEEYLDFVFFLLGSE